MEFVFWFLLGLLVYCYFGYPLLMAVWARVKARPVRRERIEPTVSVVMSVHNEQNVIAGKLNNLLGLDYPSEKVEILVGSDGSTDRTGAEVRQLKNPRIRFVEFSQRRGKMAVLNELVAQAGHEVIVFTDARQPFERNTMRELVANMADPEVGCVSGELMLSRAGGATAQGINLYWTYEKFIRAQESKVHSMLGATGAVYAIRRALFSPIPENVVLDDMYVPLKIIEKGYRAIFDGNAKAYDEVADSPREEHRRKARTLFGNYQIFALFPSLLLIGRSPVALQLVSHKLLRVLAPFFMIALFFANLSLVGIPFYSMMVVLQVLFYACAVLGAILRHQKSGVLRVLSRVCYVPYVFCLLNFSALMGFFRFLSGRQSITWEKAKEK